MVVLSLHSVFPEDPSITANSTSSPSTHNKRTTSEPLEMSAFTMKISQTHRAWSTSSSVISTFRRRSPGLRVRRAGASRCRIVACAVPPERALFNLSTKSPEMTLEDIRDAYEQCSTIPAAGERAQCYSCFGLDGDRMARYYDAVLGLEKALQDGGAGGEQRAGAGAGAGGVGGLWGWPGSRAVQDPDEFHSATASMTE